MKKVIIFVLSAVMVLSMAACGASAGSEAAVKPNESENVQIPSPWKDLSSLDEAQNEVGFDMVIPESIDGYTEKVIRTSKATGIMEVIFRSDDNEICFRKGTGDRDVSGDCNTYAEENAVELNGLTAMMKGSDGKVNLVTWSSGGYSYSIGSNAALSETEMTYLASYVSDDEPVIGGDPATWGPALDDEPVIGGDPATWGPALDENVQIPSPFIDCDTLKDAAAIAGFEVSVPASVDGYAQDSIQVIDKEMIQVFYVDDAENVILIRKAAGSEDISGDFNAYTREDTAKVGGTEVTMKGDEGLIYLAVWTSGEYTYSVSVNSGISSASMAELVAAIQ